MTKKGSWVSVSGARRVRALNKRDFLTSYFMRAFTLLTLVLLYPIANELHVDAKPHAKLLNSR